MSVTAYFNKLFMSQRYAYKFLESFQNDKQNYSQSDLLRCARKKKKIYFVMYSVSYCLSLLSSLCQQIITENFVGNDEKHLATYFYTYFKLDKK